MAQLLGTLDKHTSYEEGHVKIDRGTALRPRSPGGTALQRHIVTFQEQMARFQTFFNRLQCCPLLELEYPGQLPTAWREQVRERCPTGKGMYVFYRNDNALYVGRTDGLVQRISGHRSMTAAGQPGNSATFARILAKDEFRIAHHRDERRFSLQLSRAFKASTEKEKFLAEAIQKVQRMSVKVVQVEHTHDQTAFEVYVPERLGTRYNSFRTH